MLSQSTPPLSLTCLGGVTCLARFGEEVGDKALCFLFTALQTVVDPDSHETYYYNIVTLETRYVVFFVYYTRELIGKNC